MRECVCCRPIREQFRVRERPWQVTLPRCLLTMRCKPLAMRCAAIRWRVGAQCSIEPFSMMRARSLTVADAAAGGPVLWDGVHLAGRRVGAGDFQCLMSARTVPHMPPCMPQHCDSRAVRNRHEAVVLDACSMCASGQVQSVEARPALRGVERVAGAGRGRPQAARCVSHHRRYLSSCLVKKEGWAKE